MKLSQLNEGGQRFAAVACVSDKHGRWLLGKSLATDSRFGKWCFPGGGIEDGETPQVAAGRECWEESGVRSRPAGAPFTDPGKPGVAFVYCRAYDDGSRPRPNSEFSDMGFFSIDEMKQLDLYENVWRLVARCC